MATGCCSRDARPPGRPIRAVIVDELKADIAELYPRIGHVEMEYVWSGVLGNALHRMPQLGELTPGLWMASGFGGHGLNTTAMAGQIFGQAIVDGEDTWRLFSPYEFVWAGGRLGRAIMQGYSWWFTRPRTLRGASGPRARGGGPADERLAALRAPEERAEAQIGAAVPADQLPTEPALVELPADPVLTREPVPVVPPMTRVPLDAASPAADRGFARLPASDAAHAIRRIVCASR